MNHTDMHDHMNLTTTMNMTVGHNMTGMGHDMTGMEDHTMPGMHHNMTGMDHGGMDNHTMPPGIHHNMSGMGHDHSMHGADTTDHMHDHSMHGMDHTGMPDLHGEHGADLGHGGHQAFFNFDLPIFVLFFGWRITDRGTLAGSCVGVVLLAVVYEGLKSLREYLYRVSRDRSRKYLRKSASNGTGLDGTVTRSPEPGLLSKIFSGWHWLQGLLHIVQTTLGMFLMLVYMTFNVWLALSVSLGSGLGYLLFSWNKCSFNELDENHCI